MGETEVIGKFAELGAFALLAGVMLFYFIKTLERKDKQVHDLMVRSIAALENNSAALRDLEKAIERDRR